MMEPRLLIIFCCLTLSTDVERVRLGNNFVDFSVQKIRVMLNPLRIFRLGAIPVSCLK